MPAPLHPDTVEVTHAASCRAHLEAGDMKSLRHITLLSSLRLQ